jgi:ABC-type bacteriocin/lantibiotic exporter with double-glycine peptidase domain
VRATILYTVARIALFAVICGALVLFSVNVFLAAAIAAIAALVISYFAFKPLRFRMAEELASRGSRNARDEVVSKDADTDAEDAALDNADTNERAE